MDKERYIEMMVDKGLLPNEKGDWGCTLWEYKNK